MKTVIKVSVRVKKFSPFKYALHEMLIPGFYRHSFSTLIKWTMESCNCDRAAAESAITTACNCIDYYGYSYRDRDKLNLPNITDRYPKLKGVWKNNIKEPPI